MQSNSQYSRSGHWVVVVLNQNSPVQYTAYRPITAHMTEATPPAESISNTARYSRRWGLSGLSAARQFRSSVISTRTQDCWTTRRSTAAGSTAALLGAGSSSHAALLKLSCPSNVVLLLSLQSQLLWRFSPSSPRRPKKRTRTPIDTDLRAIPARIPPPHLAARFGAGTPTESLPRCSRYAVSVCTSRPGYLVFEAEDPRIVSPAYLGATGS